MTAEAPEHIGVLLPASYDVFWSALPLLVLFAVVATVIKVAFTPWLTVQERLLWAAFVVLVPGLGVLGWWLFLAGATRRRQRLGKG